MAENELSGPVHVVFKLARDVPICLFAVFSFPISDALFCHAQEVIDA